LLWKSTFELLFVVCQKQSTQIYKTTNSQDKMAKPLKDLYDSNYIDLLSKTIIDIYPDFDNEHFVASIFDREWQERALKQRMRHISTTLHAFLPKGYEDAITILKSTFQKIERGYALENMIFQDFVALYGLEDFEVSMDALECFTIDSSSEFAIREFILRYPDETMRQMRLWAMSDNEHVRRLASEGSRPRLPWARALPRFKENPEAILEILDILKDDASLYVRKSVANSLNDISKDNPQIVKDIAKNWIGVDKNRDWVLKHGCRTLLKSGDREVLEIFGFVENGDISLEDFRCDRAVKMGEKLTFSFLLRSTESLGKLRVEYAVSFLRQRGRYSKKVFKIAEGSYSEKSKHITRHYSFKPISTRRYYRGRHRLEIIVNGIVLGEREFLLC